MMRILFFGRLGEAAGGGEMRVDPPTGVDDIAALRDWLAQRDPALAEALAARGVRTALDQAFCGDNAKIAGAQEIAFMSPLSGG